MANPFIVKSLDGKRTGTVTKTGFCGGYLDKSDQFREDDLPTEEIQQLVVPLKRVYRAFRAEVQGDSVNEALTKALNTLEVVENYEPHWDDPKPQVNVYFNGDDYDEFERDLAEAKGDYDYNHEVYDVQVFRASQIPYGYFVLAAPLTDTYGYVRWGV